MAPEWEVEPECDCEVLVEENVVAVPVAFDDEKPVWVADEDDCE